MPVAPDLFSLQGLKNLGPTLHQWRITWAAAKNQASPALGAMPQGNMLPVGYVLMQHAERLGRPTKAYAKWQVRLPDVYCRSVLEEDNGACGDKGNLIHRIKHYRSLMPLAMEARKPMFHLSSADGAIGAHQTNVQQCHDDFSRLAQAIAARIGIGELV